MGKASLKLSAELFNVTDLQPVDNKDDPFEYTFTVQCTDCRETHDKPITLNRFDHYNITGSKGQANFVLRCHYCRREHSADIHRTKDKVTLEDSQKPVPLLDIDYRGIEFIEFHPLGTFEAKATESTGNFPDIDLAENEWYEYDDKASAEVSIQNVKWEISR